MVGSDKIGKRIPNLELAWEQISALVTDDRVDAAIVEQINQQGVNVIIAPYFK